MKKINIFLILITTSFLIIFNNIVLAELCPNVSDIQKYKFNNWLAYNSLSGTPADQAAIVAFTKNIKYFSQANWSSEYPDGPGQCYYTGDDPDQWLHDVYLINKFIQKPIDTTYWKWNYKIAICKSTIDHCVF